MAEVHALAGSACKGEKLGAALVVAEEYYTENFEEACWEKNQGSKEKILDFEEID